MYRMRSIAQKCKQKLWRCQFCLIITLALIFFLLFEPISLLNWLLLLRNFGYIRNTYDKNKLMFIDNGVCIIRNKWFYFENLNANIWSRIKKNFQILKILCNFTYMNKKIGANMISKIKKLKEHHYVLSSLSIY